MNHEEKPSQQEGNTARHIDPLLTAAKHQLEENLQHTKAALERMRSSLAEKSRECARSTDALVHEKPWPAIGLAFGIGILIGVLARRTTSGRFNSWS
jgi:ElaB/YqjD/DUF883 family membrane-anchored ribosome-binding protein